MNFANFVQLKYNTLGSRYWAGPDNETPQVKFVIGSYSLSGLK